MKRFNDLIAVVTGAGSGIGAATARRLASEGARVILVGRTEAKLKAVQAELQGPSYSFAADVTKEDDVKRLADYVEKNFGHLHILINNAGSALQSTLRNATLDEWDEMQNVNLRSVFLVSKILGSVMAESTQKEDADTGRYAIVNISSLAGHKPGLEIPHYSAAKAAVLSLTKAFALEFASFNIRVNSVSPGYVETPLTEQGMKNERFVEAIKRKTTMKRFGSPDEIANVIVFAASYEASFMTGTDLLADGGFLIR